MEIKYKKAKTDSDFKFIANLFNDKNNEFLKKKTTTPLEIKKSLKQRDHFIIKTNKNIGWFCVGIDNNIGTFGLIIDKPHQNKGYATDIIKDIEQEIKKKGGKKIEIEIFKKNKSAIAVYKKTGYTKIKNTPDTIIMSKKIN